VGGGTQSTQKKSGGRGPPNGKSANPRNSGFRREKNSSSALWRRASPSSDQAAKSKSSRSFERSKETKGQEKQREGLLSTGELRIN